MHRVQIIATAVLRLVMLCAPQLGPAQSVAERREFDVASVKLRNRDNDSNGGSIVRTPGGLTAHNADLLVLLEMAFQTRQTDLSHVPDSLRSERFDIVAKATGKISGDQYWEMLQRLLEDRFRLKYHRETKNAQLYALILPKKGSNLGPKISRSANTDCPVDPNGSNFCGVSVRLGLMIGERVSMDRIARELSPFAGLPVQNQTGVTGSFDFQLAWTPDENEPADGQAKILNGIPLDTSAPNLFTAIQQQLGLKLESRRGQLEILVIDHAENPSEN
jgi:uncharacterized protein (TIGR03435 family)